MFTYIMSLCKADQRLSRFLQMRWLQQGEAGILAAEDEEADEALEFATFDVGPPGEHQLPGSALILAK